MVRIFFRFRGKNNTPLITPETDALLLKFSRAHRIWKRTVLDKIAKRAEQEGAIFISERTINALIVRYLNDNENPLFSPHDVRETLVSYTCRSCRTGPTITRCGMSDEEWHKKVNEFFEQHPPTLIENLKRRV